MTTEARVWRVAIEGESLYVDGIASYEAMGRLTNKMLARGYLRWSYLRRRQAAGIFAFQVCYRRIPQTLR